MSDDRELRSSDPRSLRMFTVRKGLSIRWDGEVFRYGDLIPEDHPCVATNKPRILMAPESLLAGSGAQRDSEVAEPEKVEQEAPGAAYGPEDEDE